MESLGRIPAVSEKSSEFPNLELSLSNLRNDPSHIGPSIGNSSDSFSGKGIRPNRQDRHVITPPIHPAQLHLFFHLTRNERTLKPTIELSPSQESMSHKEN